MDINELCKIADTQNKYVVSDGRLKNAALGAMIGLSTLGGMTSCGEDPIADEPTKETVWRREDPIKADLQNYDMHYKDQPKDLYIMWKNTRFNTSNQNYDYLHRMYPDVLKWIKYQNNNDPTTTYSEYRRIVGIDN